MVLKAKSCSPDIFFRSFTLFFALLLTWVWLSQAAPVRAAVPEPKETVAAAVDKIIGILTDPELATPQNREKRYRLVVATVEEFFDFAEISMRTLGPRWRELDDGERRRFIELFKQFLQKNYIDRVDSYSGEEVVVKDQEIREDRRGNRFAMVNTDFVMKSQTVPVNYRLLYRGGNWLVYDVDIEGVSLVRNFRSQFEPYSFAELIRRMEKSIATGKDLEEQ
ncbi:phospholipid-binding protein MlaC [Desulfurivibrio sp. C05AmB]|uniref:MlaC/ttg2D family ABC transporter substrate-binding protein n=1 Tax=Desulfurivibrio sp. C05AmB TaxID=3374371 RepID=UPI00376EDA18